MAIATDTTPGSVLMTGDLYGMGTEPQLRPTGVTPNEYIVPSLVVDGKGRVVSAGLADIGLLCASESQCGVASIGRRIKYTSNTADLNVASTSIHGVLKAGMGVRVEDGVIGVEFPIATGSVLGVIKVGGGLQTDGDGILSVGGLNVPVATSATLGSVYVAPGNSLSIGGDGGLLLSTATAGAKGIFQVGSGLQANAGTVSLNLPTASNSVLGGVKISGGGFSIDANGVLTYSGVPLATSTTPGAIKVPTSNGLSVAVDGTLSYSPPTATTTTRGLVTVPTEGNLVVDGSGNISVPKAQTATLGLVKGSSEVFIGSGNLALPAADLYVVNEAKAATKTHFYLHNVFNYTAGAVHTPDLSIYDISTINAAGNITIANPTNLNLYPGLNFVILVSKSTGVTITWGSDYLFPGGNRALPEQKYVVNCLVIEDKIYCTPSQI